MIVIDTSAWIEFLRDTGSVVCDLRGLLARASLIPTEPTDYEEAAALYRICRHGGQTVRKLVDCLIAANAMRTSIPVLHSDDDFAVLARRTALTIEHP